MRQSNSSHAFAAPLIAAVLLVATASVSGAPLESFAWQLHDRNWDAMRAAIERAPEFGATEIHLSHAIITAIDQVSTEADTAEIVQKACELCDSLGLDTLVWAKELNIGNRKLDQDLDPNSAVGREMWNARQSAYRNAFERCPSIDGVVLQFGSCPTEVWHIRDNASEFNAATPPPDRIALTVRMIQDICTSYDKKLDVRTFSHSPTELEWMRLGAAQSEGIRVQPKEVPQDWQIYYPVNPVIGRTGNNATAVEFDLGNEYWGQNDLVFCMPDYLRRRMAQLVPLGISGVVARVERGDNHTLGSPNEVNIFAMARLVDDPAVSTDTIWNAWVSKRYGLDSASREGQALVECLSLSFDMGRKMFYVLTAWALEKGSDIPATLATECLYAKNTAQWDADFQDSWQDLCQPTDSTLARIWQEKTEAIELTERALARLEAAKPAMKEADYRELADMLQYQEQCARVWQFVTDAVFRSRVYAKSPREEDQRIIQGDVEALTALADTMAPNAPLANPKRIRAFIADVQKRVPPCEQGATPQYNTLSEVAVLEVTAESARITWRSTRPGLGHVEWGTKLPLFTERSEPGAAPSTEHEARITALSPATRYVYRVITDDAVSGDYAFTTPQTAP